LAEYNKNPYDIDARNITTIELYEKWLKHEGPQIGKTTLPGYGQHGKIMVKV